MKTYVCPNCHGQYNIGAEVLGKLVGALLGGAAGTATRNPWAAMAGVLIGTLIGHAIDESVLPKCPQCGTILELIGEALSQN